VAVKVPNPSTTRNTVNVFGTGPLRAPRTTCTHLESPLPLFLFLRQLSGTAGSVGALFIRRPQHYPKLDVNGPNVGEADSIFARQYDRAFCAAEAVLAFNLVFIFTTNLVQSEAQVSREANFVFGFVMIALFLSFGVMLVFVPRRDVSNAFNADSIEEKLAPINTKRNENDDLLAGAGADGSVSPLVENLYPLPVTTVAPAAGIHKRMRRTASTCRRQRSGR
jgi:hypothetical protein